MLLIQLGEVVFGGVGCGLYGMLAFAILTVFIAGLMVGRTPELLGKKIEPYGNEVVSDGLSCNAYCYFGREWYCCYSTKCGKQLK